MPQLPGMKSGDISENQTLSWVYEAIAIHFGQESSLHIYGQGRAI
jgi:hypothetical protein